MDVDNSQTDLCTVHGEETAITLTNVTATMLTADIVTTIAREIVRVADTASKLAVTSLSTTGVGTAVAANNEFKTES